MVQIHSISPAVQAQCALEMIVSEGDYGAVTQLSRETGISRPTLYGFKKRGLEAIEQAFTPPPAFSPLTLAFLGGPYLTHPLERPILTLWMEGHASIGGIQRCLQATTGQALSVGTIEAVLLEAQRRARDWMSQIAPPRPRPVALDEMYGNQRRGAYLSIVDALSSAVWLTQGPLPVDGEVWTLLLWEAQAHGLCWSQTVSDGGRALRQGCQSADPEGVHGRDVWHVLHGCAQVQGRLNRYRDQLQEQAPTVARQAARLQAGQRPRGRNPQTDVAAYARLLERAAYACQGLAYLSQECKTLLEVVALSAAGATFRVLSEKERQGELETVLQLLEELAQRTPGIQGQELKKLHQHLQGAMPGLGVLFRPLEALHGQMSERLGVATVAEAAWVWQRKAILGPDRKDLLALFAPERRSALKELFTAWQETVRASSPVENWHSLLRPHLAVHRVLTPGMLALIAVWHNHRVFTRGVHRNQSPLHRSGMTGAPTDWLVALGYPPAESAAGGVSIRMEATSVQQVPVHRLPLAA